MVRGHLLAPVLVFLACSAVAAASRLAADAAQLGSDKEWKERPITKIVNLLKDMQGQLDEEGKEDQELYDKLVCWCETNEKEKTKAIADGQQKVTDLSSTIEEATATASTLSTEIAALEGDIAKTTKGLAEAGEIRAKEASENEAEETDMTSTISSLKGAVESMGKVNTAFVQRAALLQVSQALRRRPEQAIAAAKPHERDIVRQLIAAASDEQGISLLQTFTGLRTAAPASGAIFGVLGQMKETFESNLASSQAEETQAVEEFGSLRSAMSSQIQAAQNKMLTDKKELAEAETLKTRSQEDKENTEAAIVADTTFLENLRKQCASIDSDFDERTKARLEEVSAIGDTIKILTSDEAQTSFSKSAQLVQAHLSSKRQAKARKATATYLAEAARRLGSPRLSFLGVRVENDTFGKIKENIDQMVQQLDKDGKDETVHKDNCVKDLKENGQQTLAGSNHKTDVETEIAALESDIAKLTEEKKRLSAVLLDAQIELKRAGENREAENKDFQTTVQDQRATAEIVKKALDRMAQVYGPKVLLQLGAGQTPPGSFKAKKKNAGGSGVMNLLEGVIKEAEEVEAEATAAENKAQQAYESFAKDTNAIMADTSRQMTDLGEHLSFDEEKEAADEGDKRHTEAELNSLKNVELTLHDNCDNDIEHFEERQASRTAEQEALKESKAIFSGAMSSLQEGKREMEKLKLQGEVDDDDDDDDDDGHELLSGLKR